MAMSGVALLDRRRGLPRLGRNCVTPDPSPTRGAKHLPRCESIQFVVFADDCDGDNSSTSTPRGDCSNKHSSITGRCSTLNDTVSTTGSASQDDTSSISSVTEDLESENARLLKELESFRSDSRLASENDTLKQERHSPVKQRAELMETAQVAQQDVLLYQQQCGNVNHALQNLSPAGMNGRSLGRNSPQECYRAQTSALELKSSDLSFSFPSCEEDSLADTRTTVMMRSFPNNYSSQMLLDLIDTQGFKGMYDFMYLPIDFMTGANLGYCFLNFTNNKNAQAFTDAFEGFSQWMVPSRKCCNVVWSDPHQGLDAYIDRYRNSPIMHRSVPMQYKPTLFKDGERIAFPPPTKNVRAPRLRYLTNS